MKFIFLLITFIYTSFFMEFTSSHYNTFMNNKEFFNLVLEYSEDTVSNSQIKFVFMKIKKNKKKKKKDLEKIRRIMIEFMRTMGIDLNQIINWNNQHYVAIVDVHERIDREVILENFSDVIEEMGEKLPKSLKKEFEADVKPEL